MLDTYKRLFETPRLAWLRHVRCLAAGPNANAYEERFVRSIKYRCLNRVIPFGERLLRTGRAPDLMRPATGMEILPKGHK
jgi:hypothetical protein